MEITGAIDEVRKQVKEWRKQGLTVGLVNNLCGDSAQGIGAGNSCPSEPGRLKIILQQFCRKDFICRQ